jgi:anti-sigma factor RsiW
MKLRCIDRKRIFADGTAEEWTALEAHGTSCAACAEELRAWKELSSGAEGLRNYDENQALWSRIEASLVQEGKKRHGLIGWWESSMLWRHVPLAWQLGLAGAMVLTLAFAGGYVFVKRNVPEPAAQSGFLKDHALAEVERTEREYMKAIDKLAIETKSELQSSNSPLMASYQEKLVVLDSAIDELRIQAGRNPSNAHLRYQLLAMYKDKEATLQEILETKR